MHCKGGGKPVRSLVYSWRKACAAARVVGRIPHDFRRTRVRDLVNAGIPEKVAMEWTGHQTREVFDRYHIVTAEDQRRALARVETKAAEVDNVVSITQPVRGTRRQGSKSANYFPFFVEDRSTPYYLLAGGDLPVARTAG